MKLKHPKTWWQGNFPHKKNYFSKLRLLVNTSYWFTLKISPHHCHTVVLISHASKVVLKILQARLQQYMNWELPGLQTGFRKGRGTRDQNANIRWTIEETKKFQKTIYFCFIGYAKSLWPCGKLKKKKKKTCGKFLKRWKYQMTLLVSWEPSMGQKP